jgi:HEAT repeat protein
MDRAAQALTSESPDTRLAGLRALAAFDLPDAEPRVLPLLDDANLGVRLLAAQLLSQPGETSVAPTLKKWLDDPTVELRRAAARDLGRIGDASAAPNLMRALGDDDPDVRTRAAVALGALGDADAAVPLAGRLGDDKDTVRLAAVLALGALADPRATVPLLGRLGDGSAAVRAAAASAIGRLHDPKTAPALLRALRDPDPDVVAAAIQALASLHQDSTVSAQPALIDLLHGGASDLAAVAAMGLAQLGDDEDLIAALDDPALAQPSEEALCTMSPPPVDALVRALGDGGPSPTSVVTVLARVADAKAAPALRAELNRGRVPIPLLLAALAKAADSASLVDLEPYLESSDPVIVSAALDAVDPIADGRLDSSLRKLLSVSSPSLRARAALLLGRVGSAADGEALVPLLDDPDGDVVVAAEAALSSLPVGSAAPALARHVVDERPTVRHGAIQALAALHGAQGDDSEDVKSALAVLAALESTSDPAAAGDVLRAEGWLVSGGTVADCPGCIRGLDAPRPAVRLGALAGLAEVGDKAATSAIEALFSDPTPAIRAAAANAVGLLGDSTAGTALRPLVADPDPTVRAAAVTALGEVGDARAADLLRPLLADADPAVRVDAITTLGLLGDARSTSPIARLVDADPDPAIQSAAAFALAHLRKKAAASTVGQTSLESLEMVDTEGATSPDQLWVARLPDGRVMAGYTDATGQALMASTGAIQLLTP